MGLSGWAKRYYFSVSLGYNWDSVLFSHEFLIVPESPSPLLGRDILSKVHASVFMNMVPSLSLHLNEQNINPRVWDDEKSVGRAQNAISVVVKLKDPHLLSWVETEVKFKSRWWGQAAGGDYAASSWRGSSGIFFSFFLRMILVSRGQWGPSSQSTQEVTPATLTAVGVVRTTVYGPFQRGARESCFQSLTTSDAQAQIHESAPQGGTAPFLV